MVKGATCTITMFSFHNWPRSISQYSNMAPRLSGQTSTFGVVFFVFKSRLGIERQKKLEKFAILTRKPWSHVWILIYRTWPINWPNESIDKEHRQTALRWLRAKEVWNKDEWKQVLKRSRLLSNWVKNLIKYNNYLKTKNIGKRIILPKKPKVAVNAVFQNPNVTLETNLERVHYE